MPSNAPKFPFRQWPFLFPLTALIPGIMLQEMWRPGRSVWLVCMSAAFAICLLARLARGCTSGWVRRISLWLPFLFAGGLLRSYEDHRYAPEWFGNHLAESTALLLEVSGRPELKPATLFIPARVIRYQKNGKWWPAIGKLNLYLYKSEKLPECRAGDRLLIPAKARSIEHHAGSFGFDYAAYMALNNTFHRSFLSGDEVILLANRDGPGPMQRLYRKILRSLERHIPDGDTRALAAAVLLNHRSSLEDSLLQAYATTGITHIIAISGMHVSLLFGLFLILLRWIRHKKYEWLKYLLAIPLVWVYILLTGLPPSAVRAGIMFSFLALGIALGKPANPINLLAATAFVLLCLKPSWLYDVGVQLSFLAVLSILIFYKPLATLLPSRHQVFKLLWDSVAVCLAAQILVFPLVIYYFHQFPVWVIPANIPATFFSLLLMVGSLLILVLDLFHLPAYWLGELLSGLTGVFHQLIYFFAERAPDFSGRLYLSVADFWTLMMVVVALSSFMMHRSIASGYLGLVLLTGMLSIQLYRDYSVRRQEQLVVYPVRQASSADYFRGKRVWSIGISPDSMEDKAFRYTIFPSRLGRRALEAAGHLPGREAFLIAGKRVLYLRQSFRLTDTLRRFKVDFLILSNLPGLQAHAWISSFQPDTIVLDGSFPSRKARNWADTLRSLGIPVHNVREAGAWHFPVSK